MTTTNPCRHGRTIPADRCPTCVQERQHGLSSSLPHAAMLCGRGCGHVFAAGELRLSSRRNGDVCLKCTLPHDTLRVDPEDTHADEILDALLGHP